MISRKLLFIKISSFVFFTLFNLRLSLAEDSKPPPKDLPKETKATKATSKKLKASEQKEHHSHNQHKELSHINNLRFTLLPSYTTVEGTQLSNGTMGTMNSSMYVAFKLDYTFKTPKWVFGFIAGRKTVTFENSDERTIMTPGHTLYRLDATVARRFKSGLIGVGVGTEDKFFYRVVNASFADADTSNDMKIYSYFSYDFLKYKKYKGLINAKIGFNPKEESGIYDIQTGFFYTTSLKIDRAIADDQAIGLELFFKSEHYKTQQLEFATTELGLGVSFNFDWGNE